MKADDTVIPSPQQATFFTLNNTYLIPDGSKLNSLLDDALVLLNSGIDVFSSQGDNLDNVPGGWAGVHVLNQARAVFMQIYDRVYERAGNESQAEGKGLKTS